MSVSFCLPHPVAVSAFMICGGLCACTEMLLMCQLYVSFGSNVRPRTFGYVAMGSAVLFILRSRVLLYSAGYGCEQSCFVWQCEIVLFCPVKIFMYLFLGCTRACVCRCDGDFICVGHDPNRCSVWWYVCSAKKKLNSVGGGPTEGACSMTVPAMSKRPRTSALRMNSTHPAIMNANHR